MQKGGFMKLYGFYILKDDYFKIMNDKYIKSNKDGNRPFYYCIKEEKSSDTLYWMIPLSSKIEKYKLLIDKRVEFNKPVDGLHICKLPNGKESVFLIQDIIPVTDLYIEREYTLGNNHLFLYNEKEIEIINRKANRVIKLIKNGVRLTPTSPNVNKILNILINNTK